MAFFTYDLPLIILQIQEGNSQLGDFGNWSCEILSRTIEIIPSSPITLASISQGIGANVPFLGGELIYLVLSDLSKVLTIVIAWKIFKAIPGKFS